MMTLIRTPKIQPDCLQVPSRVCPGPGPGHTSEGGALRGSPSCAGGAKSHGLSGYTPGPRVHPHTRTNLWKPIITLLKPIEALLKPIKTPIKTVLKPIKTQTDLFFLKEPFFWPSMGSPKYRRYVLAFGFRKKDIRLAKRRAFLWKVSPLGFY